MAKFSFPSSLLLLIVLSCNSTDLKLDYKNSEMMAYNLLKISVDTILNKNSEINTPNYVLDVGNLTKLNHKGVGQFISEKNRFLPTTKEDSTLIGENDNQGLQVKKSMILKITEIKIIGDGLTKVKISKFISTHKHLEMDLYLKRRTNRYTIYSCFSKYVNKIGN